MLPVIIFLISITMTAFFYHLLPAQTAYNFKSGSPDNLINREAITAWMLIPQLLFVLLAAAIVWGVARLSAQFQQVDSRVVKKVLLIMGNMMALPQIILSFAMLDIFSYNAYQTHLMPLWLFAVIFLGLGGIILGVFFVSAIQGAVRQPEKPPENAPRSNND